MSVFVYNVHCVLLTKLSVYFHLDLTGVFATAWSTRLDLNASLSVCVHEHLAKH
jgi:hypothetical protein